MYIDLREQKWLSQMRYDHYMKKKFVIKNITAKVAFIQNHGRIESI